MLQGFFRATQPADLRPSLFRCSKAEMQSKIVLRAETSAASNLLRLAPIVRGHNHTRPDGCAVGCGSEQLYQQPGVRRGQLIAQQRRIIIQVIDHDADASGIEDISKSRTPTAPRLKESR